MKTVYHVLRHPHYTALVLVVAFATLGLMVWVPNRSLLSYEFWLPGISIGEHVTFVLSFYASLFTNFTPLAALLSITLALMFGVNAALYLFLVQRSRGAQGVRAAGVVSIGAVISGFFGIGCAACSSVLIASLLSTLGAASLVAFLPFGGEEFMFLALGLLGYACVTLITRIKKGNVC